MRVRRPEQRGNERGKKERTEREWKEREEKKEREWKKERFIFIVVPSLFAIYHKARRRRAVNGNGGMSPPPPPPLPSPPQNPPPLSLPSLAEAFEGLKITEIRPQPPPRGSCMQAEMRLFSTA